jgi:Kef-type K+ transport system membrane component KefB
MAAEDLLVKFFIILTVLFFFPKVINRITKTPDPISELILGIIFGLALPSFFFLDDMLQILSTIGIITLFVFSGMDIDVGFIKSNKKFFIENIVLHILIFITVGITIQFFLAVSYQIAFLISLAVTTPSASFILSSIKTIEKECKQWVEGKAIAGEVTGIVLLIILLSLTDVKLLLLSFVTIVLLITILPYILNILYKKIFSKLIGTEFSFIFVVAVISAFATEFIGIHYLVGAFIAGYVSKQFINKIIQEREYDHLSEPVGKQLIIGFGFFALIFAPFYFFTVGLSIKSSMFAFDTLILAILLCISIVLFRLAITSGHRMIRIKENISTAIQTSAMIIPTLVFTFVIAEILLKQFQVNFKIYSILMLYGLFTAIIGTAFFLKVLHNKEKCIQPSITQNNESQPDSH